MFEYGLLEHDEKERRSNTNENEDRRIGQHVFGSQQSDDNARRDSEEARDESKTSECS
jgi:hypothetical protein